MLSILIPVYNFNCVALVEALHSQCTSEKIPFEILVLDDTSKLFKEENRAINKLDHCQYIESELHYGRAKIRNELGKRARYENLLFIDSDALVDCPDFIQNYLQNTDQADVLIGGMKYSEHPPKENALRWYYGSKREYLPASVRNQNPYRSLISFNLMIKKAVFDKHPFDEASIEVEKSAYGHEDTLLGLRFKEYTISVFHLDNQLVHDYHETNAGFLANSLIAVEKYVNNPQFRTPEVRSEEHTPELHPYTKLFRSHPFDEASIEVEKSAYGHEDTLLGLRFKEYTISVFHLDNQLVHDYHETNAGFLANSLIAVEKYVNNPQFRTPEVVEQIKIFKAFEKVKRFGLVGLLSFLYRKGEARMKNNLFSHSPSLRLFDFYRLSYLAYYDKKNRDQFQ